ncbi:MAG: ABC transporter ATP-binding protein [bacterium]|nr:ABC transporter ATP-binding protein [bacterium]
MNAIEIKNISKKFKTYHNKESNLKYVFLNLLKGKRSTLHSVFWALKDINFNIQKGKTIGFIGRNGSGKSTLLKLISRILYPDGGAIAAHGKISTLIELGSGFHPDLSGRENVYINASILGLSRAQVNEKFDEIVAFSGLEEFIDNPVKTYSSGMYVRLGFSVAINIDPDILLVDEVLAVGDEIFQRKCIEKINEFKKMGKTIVFVSHDLKTIEELCDQVFLLHNGRLVKEGKPVEVISEYHRLLIGSSEFLGKEKEGGLDLTNSTNRWGSRAVEIKKVVFLDDNDEETTILKIGGSFRARIHYRAHREVKNPVFGVAVYNDNAVHITGPNTRFDKYETGVVKGDGYVEYKMPVLPLMSGAYFFSASIYDSAGVNPLDHWELNWKFHVIEDENVTDRFGLLSIPREWRHEREKFRR